MKIVKFKLIDNGFGGIQCEGTELKQKDGIDVFVDFTLKYKVPVPGDIVSMVQGLKYYFLWLTGLFPEDCEKHMDFSLGIPRMVDFSEVKEKKSYAYVAKLMDKLTITGFRMTSDDLIITGKMYGLEESIFAINTPLFQFSHIAAGEEEGMKELCIKIRKAVKQFIEDVKLRRMEPRQYLLDLFQKNTEELKRVQQLTDAEAEAEQIEQLVKKGFIVVRKDEVLEEIHQMRKATDGVSTEEIPAEETGVDQY